MHNETYMEKEQWRSHDRRLVWLISGYYYFDFYFPNFGEYQVRKSLFLTKCVHEYNNHN